MVLRVLGALACLGLGARAVDGDRRRFPDEEVLASQRYFSSAWRDHFNKGDAQYCGNSYLENASLHAALGPASAELKRLIGLSDPAVLRGKSAISSFWNKTMTVVGLKDFRAYEEKGEYTSTAFVVDDNTVIVEGRFTFNAVSGQIFSELWVRAGEEWKLKSMMLAFQEMQTGATLGVEGSEQGKVKKEKEAEDAKKDASSKEGKKDEKDYEQDKKDSKDENDGKKGKANIPKTGNVMQQEGSALPASRTSPVSGPFLLVVILLACGVVGILVRRGKKRREAAIAGFEAMLG